MKTISASEFQVSCLDILDRLDTGELDRLVVTKHGRPVAIVTAPLEGRNVRRSPHGIMRGSVVIPEGVDLTEPADDEPFDAAGGRLHR